jgi:hypothetical protein
VYRSLVIVVRVCMRDVHELFTDSSESRNWFSEDCCVIVSRVSSV